MQNSRQKSPTMELESHDEYNSIITQNFKFIGFINPQRVVYLQRCRTGFEKEVLGEAIDDLRRVWGGEAKTFQ